MLAFSGASKTVRGDKGACKKNKNFHNESCNRHELINYFVVYMANTSYVHTTLKNNHTSFWNRQLPAFSGPPKTVCGDKRVCNKIIIKRVK